VIALLDSPDSIARKIKRSVTDSGRDIVVSEDKPGVEPGILSAIGDVSTPVLEERFGGEGYGRLKQAVSEAVVGLVEPIQARYREIRSDAGELDRLLRRGADRAREVASGTLAEVQAALGLISKSVGEPG